MNAIEVANYHSSGVYIYINGESREMQDNRQLAATIALFMIKNKAQTEIYNWANTEAEKAVIKNRFSNSNLFSFVRITPPSSFREKKGDYKGGGEYTTVGACTP